MKAAFRKKPVLAHAWENHPDGWYVEPSWVPERLFEAERFIGVITDPCCGLGRIPRAARAAGLRVVASDIVDRGYERLDRIEDFLKRKRPLQNVVGNPPFNLMSEFCLHAVSLAHGKVAMIVPLRRLPAAGEWLKETPHVRTWYLTPRPSMPPGPVALEYERRGVEPSGGKQDFCILIWRKGYRGPATTGWLHRDRGRQ